MRSVPLEKEEWGEGQQFLDIVSQVLLGYHLMFFITTPVKFEVWCSCVMNLLQLGRINDIPPLG